jgi:hypothetical protein
MTRAVQSVVERGKMPVRLLKLTLLLCSRISFLLFTAALLSSSPLRAQEMVVTLDPAQTAIHYTLGATAHTVHGTFELEKWRYPLRSDDRKGGRRNRGGCHQWK